MKKHNGVISFWKFMFSLMIIIYHGHKFSASPNDNILLAMGSIGVEFFFIVSGYLMAKTALNKKDDKNLKDLGLETLQFIWKKFKVFFPYLLVCFICGLIVKGIYDNLTLRDYILSIFDLFLLRMAGFRETVVNGATWYISAMFICMLILYPLIRKYKYNFVYICCPIIIIFLCGWMYQNHGSLRAPDLWIGFAYKGVIRAFIELCLGALIYPITEKIKKIEFTKIGKILISIIEIFGFIIPFILSQFIEKATRYDYIMLIILSISIILAFSDKTLDQNLFNKKIIFYLEKLSLPMYVSHTFIRTFVNKSSYTLDLSYYGKMGIYIILTFIISIIMMHIIEKLRKKQFYIPKLKKVLVGE